MPYFKWRAYDDSAQEHSGIDEAPRYELVVLKILQRGWTPACIDKIEYDEFLKLRSAYVRLTKFEHIKKKIQAKNEPQSEGAVEQSTAKQNSRYPYLYASLIWLVIAALALILFHYWI